MSGGVPPDKFHFPRLTGESAPPYDSSRFRIFPVAVIGSDGTISTMRGYL